MSKKLLIFYDENIYSKSYAKQLLKQGTINKIETHIELISYRNCDYRNYGYYMNYSPFMRKVLCDDTYLLFVTPVPDYFLKLYYEINFHKIQIIFLIQKKTLVL